MLSSWDDVCGLARTGLPGVRVALRVARSFILAPPRVISCNGSRSLRCSHDQCLLLWTMSFLGTEMKPLITARALGHSDQRVSQCVDDVSQWEGGVCTYKRQKEEIYMLVPYGCLSSLQLLSHIEKLRTSMIDDLNASNVFYKKRIEELGQRLQEQNELIITQRQQVFWCIYYIGTFFCNQCNLFKNVCL